MLQNRAHAAGTNAQVAHRSELKDRIAEINVSKNTESHSGDKEGASDPLEPVNLVVFNDGVKLHNQPFMHFNDVLARALIKDIQDGEMTDWQE